MDCDKCENLELKETTKGTPYGYCKLLDMPLVVIIHNCGVYED